MKAICRIFVLIALLCQNSYLHAQSSNWHYIGQTDTTFMKISVAGSPGNWIISDVAPFTPSSGYEERYWINDVLVKGGKLTNHSYQSNYILDIKKHVVKPSVPDDLSTWTVDGWPGSSNTDGQTFGPRADVGCQSIIMFDADDNKPGLAWLDRTPSWYLGEHTVSWPTRAPNMQLPTGKVMAYSFKLDGAGEVLRQSKGETFTRDHSDIEKKVGFVAGLNQMQIQNPNGDRDYWRGKADIWPLYGIQSFEVAEGDPYVPHDSQQFKWYLERLRERYTAAGRTNYVLLENYGGYDYVSNNIWPYHANANVENLRYRYTGSAQDILDADHYLNFFNGVTNGINLKHYGTNPAGHHTNMLRIAKIEGIKKVGYKAITFGWGMMEISGPTAWVAGYGWQTNHPNGGVVQRNELAQQNFDDAVLNGFISMWWGDGFWCWDGQSARNSNPSTMDVTYDPNHTTLLNGANL